MKNSLLILLCISISLFSRAQESEKVKQKELGFAFKNLDNFGLIFKTGTNKALWRFQTSFISGTNKSEVADSLESKNNGAGISFAFGREYRKKIVDNLEFRIGGDLSYGYSQSKSKIDDKSIYNRDGESNVETQNGGINLVLGFNYVVKEKLVFGIELLPGINYFSTVTRLNGPNLNDGLELKRESTRLEYGFNSNSALLSVAYRF